MPELPITIGQILVMRGGFEQVADDAEKSGATRRNARLLIQLLDELVERREKEGRRG
jgi:hypothetical protein